MKIFKIVLSLIFITTLLSCEKEIRNIANNEEPPIIGPPPVEVIPVDINEQGFGLLEHMQGQWVGSNKIIADTYDWFTFDYRAISASHIHGIFEGGSVGNLLTSFFVTDFKDTRTILARNGGLLNGIYRSSYFVLDSVRTDVSGDFYRLVDAKGGTNTMWMELRFTGDSLYFNAYTSRLGLNYPPTRHMTFKAVRANYALAETAALAVDFPQNIPAWDFSDGFNEAYFYVNDGETEAKSASFLAYDESGGVVEELAYESGDPFTISDHPYIATLDLSVVRNPVIEGKDLFVNLSYEPLTDASGYYMSEEAFNTVLLFPSIAGTEDAVRITYLHPGEYYITVIADVNSDGYPSTGDYSHPSQTITISPNGSHSITIDDITTEN